MVTQGGHENAALVRRLFEEGYRFDFFQAVRLLEHHRRNRLREIEPEHSESSCEEQNAGFRAADGAVQFRSVPGLQFPAGPIQRIETPKPDPETGRCHGLPQIFVTMLGLTGPSGVLPEHYTQLLSQRAKYGDRVLGEFLELFHHRLVSLFHEAWRKYRLPMSYERARSSGHHEDLFTSCLLSLVGMGTTHQRDRLAFPDEAILNYAGLFADTARSASSLEGLLTDYFGFSVEVKQFQGRWLYLDDDDHSRVAGLQTCHDDHAVLGVDFVAGGRVWDVQGKLRLRLGPLNYSQFCRLLPGGDDCRALEQMTRLYVGPEYEFDVQPVLAKDDIPSMRLDSTTTQPARLGWNTWLATVTPEADAENVIFKLDSN